MNTPTRPSCSITILTATSPQTKVFKIAADNSIDKEGYQGASTYHLHERQVRDIYGLHDLLDNLESHEKKTVIRGKSNGNQDQYGRVLRRSIPRDGEPAYFREKAHRWVMLDVDNIKCPLHLNPAEDPVSAIKFLIGLLPGPFQNATCHWQFSSSQNVTKQLGDSRPMVLRAHIWFWLSRLVSSQELKVYFVPFNEKLVSYLAPDTKFTRYTPIDTSVFNSVQPNYTATPIFKGELVDPLDKRSGLLTGDCDVVDFPIVDVELQPAKKQNSKSGKKGLVTFTKKLRLKNIQQIESALATIPSTDRQTWLDVGMALHSTNSKKGEKLWDEWSLSSDNYDAEDQESVWQSFSNQSGGITIGTIYHLAREYGWQNPWNNQLIEGIPPLYSEPFMSVKKGIFKMGKLFEDFMNNPKQGDEPRVMAVEGGAGSGKTTRTLAIAQAKGHKIEFYVPSHDLGTEAIQRLVGHHGFADAKLIKGRHNTTEDVSGSEVTLCHKLLAIEALADKGVHSVFGLLCSRKKGKETVLCPHFKECLYIGQFTNNQIRILPHAYLPLNPAMSG